MEQLVFLQRSLERQDIDAFTAEDFRVERQNVMLERKKKMRYDTLSCGFCLLLKLIRMLLLLLL